MNRLIIMVLFCFAIIEMMFNIISTIVTHLYCNNRRLSWQQAEIECYINTRIE